MNKIVFIGLVMFAIWWKGDFWDDGQNISIDADVIDMEIGVNTYKFIQSEEFTQDVRLLGTNPQTSKVAPIGLFAISSHIFIMQPLEENNAAFEKYMCEQKFDHLASSVKVMTKHDWLNEAISEFEDVDGRRCARLTATTLEAIEHTHKGTDLPPEDWNETNSKFNFETTKMLWLSDFEQIDC